MRGDARQAMSGRRENLEEMWAWCSRVSAACMRIGVRADQRRETLDPADESRVVSRPNYTRRVLCSGRAIEQRNAAAVGRPEPKAPGRSQFGPNGR